MKILFAGEDFKFVNNIIDHIKKTNNVKIDKWKYQKIHYKTKSMKLLKWADVIFCEWCLGNAVWYSKQKLSHQKLYIRIHRYDAFTTFPNLVLWDNVDKIIFIAPKIKEITINKIPQITNKACLIFNYVPKNISTISLDNRKYNIGLLGYTPHYKRPDLSIKILQKLIKLNSKYKLIIKGKLPNETPWIWRQKEEQTYYYKLIKYINDYNLQNNVIFEKHSNIHNWFSNIGYIISCSDIEGSHQAVAEGMYAGCIPMISGKWYYEYGADLIYPKKYCYKDIDEIVTKIEYFNNNEELYEKEKKYCKEYSYINFNEDKVLADYYKLIVKNEYETIELQHKCD